MCTNMFAAMPTDGKEIAFASNFEVNLHDEEEQKEEQEEIHSRTQEDDMNTKLNKLYNKHPELDKMKIMKKH